MPAVFNAANEEAAAAFLNGRTGFRAITRIVGETLGAAGGWATDPDGVDEVLAAEGWARAHARELVRREL